MPYIDEAIRPDLAERQVKADEEQVRTNRIYALIEFLAARPVVPMINGAPDPEIWGTIRESSLAAAQAIGDIARASSRWVAQDGPGRDEDF